MYVIRKERAHQVHGEERQPAQDETADDDAQGLRRLGLHTKSLHLFAYNFVSPTRPRYNNTYTYR